MKTVPTSKTQSYFLVAAEIMFQVKDQEGINMLRLNTVVMSQDPRFAVVQIARAQQSAQMQFHQKMENPLLEVLDVIILGIMPLGLFTHEEFNLTAPGTTIKTAH